MANVLERQLKRLGLYGLARLATPPRMPPSEQDLAAARRILVVRPDERIGNAILIIPLLKALKQRFPEAHLSLILSRRYWDLCEFIPAVDEFIGFDKKHYARNPFAFVALIRRLRRSAYALVFDASGDHSVSFTHLAITACSGGRFRIGHSRGQANRSYDVAVSPSVGDVHETQRHLNLLKAITTAEADPRPLLKATTDSGYAERLFREFEWRRDQSTVIIHPGARGQKRWSPSKFSTVARSLISQGIQVGVVWGPADTEPAGEMLKSCPPEVKAIGALSFRDFVSLIRNSDVFFSGDCGPMHLAAAAPPRAGVVAVFVADRIFRFGALGPNDVAVVDDGTNSCVGDITSRILALTRQTTVSELDRSVTV